MASVSITMPHSFLQRARIQLGLVMLVLSGSLADAQQPVAADLQWLSLINPSRQAYIEVEDDVTGGCWTNVVSVRNSAELEFIRSGFRLSAESFNRVVLSAFGSRSGAGTCTVVLSVTLYVPDLTRHSNGAEYIVGMGNKSIFRSTAFATGSTEYVNISIAEMFNDQIRELLVVLEHSLNDIEEGIMSIVDVAARERWLSWFRSIR